MDVKKLAAAVGFTCFLWVAGLSVGQSQGPLMGSSAPELVGNKRGRIIRNKSKKVEIPVRFISRPFTKADLNVIVTNHKLFFLSEQITSKTLGRVSDSQDQRKSNHLW
jgi:hypothetical protein